MGKWLNRFKEKYPEDALSHSDNVDIVSPFPTLSTMSNRNIDTPGKTHDLRLKRNALEKIIKQVSDLYGGDDADFLHEYTANIISTCNLDDAFNCFHDLVKYYEEG